MSLRFGYGLNGFADHRLEDALVVLAELGYDGVALTLDHAHLDPCGPGLAQRVDHARRLLERFDLDVVVETGGRYVLDARNKHHPTFVSDVGAHRRIDLVATALRVARDLGAPVASCWSGTLPPTATAEQGHARVRRAVEQLLPVADEVGVTLALEPEPGMFLERVGDVAGVVEAFGRPRRLGLTVDVGHLVCTEDERPEDVVRRHGDLIANVQIDDMVRGVHEHLPFGDGEVDLPDVLAALDDIAFGGLVHVELPRHSFAAPVLAAQSIRALREGAHTADRLTRRTS
ncbi:sugar phosphate isomerase/epimerase family protein [Phycicoccus flavus]|uniref:Sugar phosphate isomerase/epimerase n=1 Tax=Phycicoccus flavus TaxID=2502783 RepID=A0A8T6R1L5_9MICO|nr:sugar phosphate isomerase/epimerase family protein [Phycicoccus flavus]NHA67857.1 sugar phosphate isomerase/epimerase [Phycicoccus flavus]